MKQTSLKGMTDMLRVMSKEACSANLLKVPIIFAIHMLVKTARKFRSFSTIVIVSHLAF